jgi:hypothetical protein
VAGFARRHGLQEQRIRWWLGRLAELDGRPPAAAGAEAAPFALVRVVESRAAVAPPATAGVAAPAASAGASARLDVVIGGHVVRVGQGFCAETLRRIVSALAGGAC